MSEPLVLIPGLMCDARLFAAQLPVLGRSRPVMVVPPVTYDRVDWIVEEMIEHLPPRFALLGSCLGGSVAMELLFRAPGRVSRVALLSTNPLPDTAQQGAAREPQIVKARSGQTEAALRDIMPADALAPGVGRGPALGMFLRMGLDLGPAVLERQLRAMQRRSDQQGLLRKLRQPALIACGAQDTLTPPRRHEFMAALIPQARLAVIEGAGHLLPLEQPGAVTDLLRDWLAEPING